MYLYWEVGEIMKYLLIGLVVVFIAQGLGYAVGNVVPTAFSASANSFFLAILFFITYLGESEKNTK